MTYYGQSTEWYHHKEACALLGRYEPVESSTLIQFTPDIDFSTIRIRHESIRLCFFTSIIHATKDFPKLPAKWDDVFLTTIVVLMGIVYAWGNTYNQQWDHKCWDFLDEWTSREQLQPEEMKLDQGTKLSQKTSEISMFYNSIYRTSLIFTMLKAFF